MATSRVSSDNLYDEQFSHIIFSYKRSSLECLTRTSARTYEAQNYSCVRQLDHGTKLNFSHIAYATMRMSECTILS